MAQLAIKGHATRGKEVIEILEMLGGNNLHGYVADSDCFGFYLGDKTRNIYYDWFYNFEDEDTAIFTLEEFLEKFPYKVGDKVQRKGATSCGSVFEVEKMKWVGDHVEYTVKRLWYYNSYSTVTAEDLQLYKEETMDKTVFDANAQCCDIMNHLIKKETIEGKITMNEDKGTLVAIDLTREFRKADDIEVILGDYEFVLKDGKTYFVKKNKYPKTYEECVNIFNCTVETVNLETLKVLRELIYCRNAYWKIAGEQMGLGKPWEPDWTISETKFTIVESAGMVVKTADMCNKQILAFPTEEMRDAFYKNFKDLIEQCRELL